MDILSLIVSRFASWSALLIGSISRLPTWLAGNIQESRIFYPDSVGGGLASEGFWKDGKREGIWRNWYANGVLMDSLTYVNGERVGEQFSYDSTGHLYMHRTEAGKKRPVIMHKLWE